MEKIKGYKIDYVKNTMTITKDFAIKMQAPDSDEYAFVQKVLADFPGMRLTHRTHRTPSSYTNSRGEKSRCNQFKNLTYTNMEKFIAALPNSEDYIQQYSFLKSAAVAVQTNGYAVVRKWFEAQFPKYRSNPLFYITGEAKVVNAIDFVAMIEKDNEEQSAA